jgi:hypothetical protein
LDINAPAAIRDQQFKLIHAFVDNPLSDWYQSDERNDDDSILDISGTCSQSEAISGTYTKFFFDLKNDPYETTNLYDDAEYATQISKLYSKFDDFKDIAAEDTHSGTPTYEPTTDDDAVVFTHAPSPTTYDPDLTHAPTPANEILVF